MRNSICRVWLRSCNGPHARGKFSRRQTAERYVNPLGWQTRADKSRVSSLEPDTDTESLTDVVFFSFIRNC